MFTHSHKVMEPVSGFFDRINTKNQFQRPLIEGAKVINSIAPIDHSTGCRDSIGQILKRAVNDPVKARLVSSLLQELPSIVSDSRVSDDDKFNLIVEHFQCGTPAEVDQLRKSLTPFVNSLLAEAKGKKEYEAPKVGAVESPGVVPASPEPSASV